MSKDNKPTPSDVERIKRTVDNKTPPNPKDKDFVKRIEKNIKR